MESVRDRKKTLRKSVAQILKALPEEYRVSASANIQDQVLASEEYRRAERIFLYIAMPTEPEMVFAASSAVVPVMPISFWMTWIASTMSA